MEKALRRPVQHPFPVLFLSLLAAGTTACGSDDQVISFQIRTSTYAVSGTTEVIAQSNWLVYFASEAFQGPAGTDLNLDGDLVDDVAVAVPLVGGTEVLPPGMNGGGIAARSAAVIGDEVWLAVVEGEDGVDWNGANGTADLVLLHWNQTTGVTTFVDTLDPTLVNVPFEVVLTRLYYPAEAMPMGDETSARYVEQLDPLTPVTLSNVLGGGPLNPLLLGQSNGLLFWFLDESVDGDQNADGDATDGFVLALTDGTDTTARLQNTGLALRDADAPFEAVITGPNDWLVGCLVNEADQGNTNLNDPALFVNPIVPAACAGMPDGDTADDVLHYLDYQDFVTATSTPVNTGLAGQDRIVAVLNGTLRFLATLSSEADATCDLNQDTDQADVVARWVEAVTPIAPPNDPAALHAVATATMGGSMGLAWLTTTFVAVVDEAADSRDLDGKPEDHDLVGWIDPAQGATAAWTFAHQNADPAEGTGIFEDVNGDTIPDPDLGGQSEPYAGTNYMVADAVEGRLSMAFLEEVPGTNPRVASINNNANCAVGIKDADLIDSLPIWADFAVGPTLDFDGMGYAINVMNPGVVNIRGFSFFRVDEAADATDYNGNGTITDLVLFRNPYVACLPQPMGTASAVVGPVIESDGLVGGAFYVSEAMDGNDLNQDGDMTDLVLRYFNF